MKAVSDLEKQFKDISLINARWVRQRDEMLLAGANTLTVDELSAQLDAHLESLRIELEAYRAQVLAEAKKAAATGVVNKDGIPIKAPRGVIYIPE